MWELLQYLETGVCSDNSNLKSSEILDKYLKEIRNINDNFKTQTDKLEEILITKVVNLKITDEITLETLYLKEDDNEMVK